MGLGSARIITNLVHGVQVKSCRIFTKLIMNTRITEFHQIMPYALQYSRAVTCRGVYLTSWGGSYVDGRFPFNAWYATPPSKAATVKPCAATLRRIIFCDITLSPVFSCHRPYERAPIVTASPTETRKLLYPLLSEWFQFPATSKNYCTVLRYFLSIVS